MSNPRVQQANRAARLAFTSLATWPGDLIRAEDRYLEGVHDDGAAGPEQSAELPERWNALPAERWDDTLDFFGNQRPAAAMAWSFLFDIIHHRGQITTHLPPMGSTVPQIYGSSADGP